MGRPINKRFLGDGGTNDQALPAIVKIGSGPVVENGYIVSQRSETLFVVSDRSTQGSCRLVDKTTPGDNEFLIQGFEVGSSDPINIRKLHNRTVIDFNNVVYDWEVQNDSTANTLILTRVVQ